jgi:geranylgeranyl pyrophosphate synthase
LVHDDLPTLDNDDWRRGKPACHKAFDEATALLVGDALQTLAFEWLLKTPVSDACKVTLLSTFAKAVGHAGMVGGQSLEFETNHSADILETIHRLKTGALIQASVLLPAIACDVPKEYLEKLSDFGATLGLAFQMQDDILDLEQDCGRVHLPRPNAAEKLAELKRLAASHLESLPHESGILSALTQYFLNQVCAV